jgi:hypothetical protein
MVRRALLIGALLAGAAMCLFPAATMAEGLLDPLRRDDDLHPRTPPETIQPLPTEDPATIETAIATLQKQIAAVKAEPLKPITRAHWLAAFQARVKTVQDRLATAHAELKTYEQGMQDDIRRRRDALKKQHDALRAAAARGGPPDGVSADQWVLEFDESGVERNAVKAAEAAIPLRIRWRKEECLEPLEKAIAAMRKRLARMKAEGDEPFTPTRAMHEALKVRAERLRQLRERLAALQAAQAEARGGKPSRAYPRRVGVPPRSTYWFEEVLGGIGREISESGMTALPKPGQVAHDQTLAMAQWLRYASPEDQILLAIAEMKARQRTIRKRLKDEAASVPADEKQRLESQLQDLSAQRKVLEAKYVQEAPKQLDRLRSALVTLGKEIARLEAIKTALKPDEKPPAELEKLAPTKADLAFTRQKIPWVERQLKRVRPTD